MTATSVSVPMTASAGSRWSPVLKIGLLGGIVAIYLALVGIMTALAGRMIITGVVSLGQIILLSVFILFGYMAAQRAAANQSKPPVLWCLFSGAVAGLIISLFLSALTVIAPAINLRSIFINASPELWKLLTFDRGVPVGLYLLIGVGVLVGALSAGFSCCPIACAGRWAWVWWPSPSSRSSIRRSSLAAASARPRPRPRS
jgi:hypothetical protein